MIKIYHTQSGYPEQRNFLYLQNSDSNVWYKKEYDIFKILTHLKYKLKGKILSLHLNTHKPFFPSKKKVYHFFNAVSYAKSPWVSTFEQNLPRFEAKYTKQMHKAVKLMASIHCKKLIAISDYAGKWEINYLRSNFPEYAEQIIPKIEVIHPPQKLNINKVEDKGPLYTSNEKITFTFIGNQFFRKGGRETLNVFKALQKSHPNFELNIVTNFSTDSYASGTSINDVSFLKNQLKDLPSNIIILGTIPNNEVIDLLKKTHVALLPTYADTYGYFVLEAQSCGCPVVSTNIEALPEINNNDCGWIIEVPKNNNGTGMLKPEENRSIFRKKLESSLNEIITNIVNNPEIIKAKAVKALDRIQNYHNPKSHAQKLIDIYKESLK